MGYNLPERKTNHFKDIPAFNLTSEQFKGRVCFLIRSISTPTGQSAILSHMLSKANHQVLPISFLVSDRLTNQLYWSSICLNIWVTDLLSVWMTNRQTDKLTYLPTKWQTKQLSNRQTAWLADKLNNWQKDRSTDSKTDWLTNWAFNDWLSRVDWSMLQQIISDDKLKDG